MALRAKGRLRKAEVKNLRREKDTMNKEKDLLRYCREKVDSKVWC